MLGLQPFLAHSQGLQVSGTISDKSTSEVLPGATVAVKGTTVATISDQNGKYKITAAKGATLVIDYIGMKSVERLVENAGIMDFALEPENLDLNEVVVVGYGTQSKKNLISSISTIKSAEIKRNPVADLSNTLAGRVTGVIAKQSSGEPGSDGSQILVRGVSTFNGSSSPLFVIDGIVRSQYDFAFLNPNEVESVNILKDASSAAIFGVKGANGVILVTTKRGSAGKLSVNYSMNYGSQSAVSLPDFSDSFTYATLYNEALANDGREPLFTEEEITKFKDGSDPDLYPNTDWGKILLGGSAPMIQQNLSINGGNEKARYFVSLGYLNQQGLYETLSNKRYNARANLDLQLTKTTQLSVDLSGRIEDKDAPVASSTNIMQEAFRNPPIFPHMYSDGKLANPRPYPNPYAYIQEEAGYNRNNYDVLLTTFQLTQDIPWIDGLTLKGVLAFDKTTGYNKRWNDNITLYERQVDNTLIPTPYSNPSLNEQFNQYSGTELQGQINYNKKIAQDHEVSALVLFLQKTNYDRYLNGGRNTYTTSALDVINAGPTLNQYLGGGGNEYGLLSTAARFNYIYKNKYLLQASVRQDQSENFAPDKRKGIFPAVSVGWIASEESFIRDIAAIEFLKLRASYGKLGNDQISSRFGYYARYDLANNSGGYAGGPPFNFGGYAFGGQYSAGLAPGPLANPNITWETSTKTDIGAEFSLLNRFLTADVVYFHERREGILAQRNLSVPTSFGANLPTENIGIVVNKGFEISLNHEKQLTKNFSYHLGGNITKAANEIIFADESPGVSEHLRRTGRAINGYYGLRSLGLFVDQEDFDNSPKTAYTNLGPGDIKYEDINGDGKIDNDDRTYLGKNNIPGIIYGINGGFAFKGLELNFLFQGAEQVNQRLKSNAVWSFYNGGKVTNEWLDRWTPNNTDATMPRVLIIAENNQLESDFWIKDASYLRLKNVEVAYTLAPEFFSKIGAQNIRISASGQNLLTFTDLLNVDPENTNIDGWYYPQQRVYNVGLSIQF